MIEDEKNNEVKDIKKTDAKFEVKKQSELKKFRNRFISEDAGQVGEYLVSEIIIPKCQALIVDSLKYTVDFIFFGKSGGSRKRDRYDNVSYIDYKDYSRKRDGSREERPKQSSNSVVSLIREIEETREFNSKPDGEEVISDIVAVLNRYDSCSVADLCDLLEIRSTIEAANYGWYDVKDFEVVRKPFSSKYMIKCAKIVPLK